SCTGSAWPSANAAARSFSSSLPESRVCNRSTVSSIHISAFQPFSLSAFQRLSFFFEVALAAGNARPAARGFPSTRSLLCQRLRIFRWSHGFSRFLFGSPFRLLFFHGRFLRFTLQVFQPITDLLVGLAQCSHAAVNLGP